MKEKEIVELVNKAIAKDNQAMETLYNTYYKDVLFVCKKLSLNDADANDIAQDAFMDAFSKLNTLNDKTKFKQWVCRIANNKALNLLKHNNVLKFENIDDDNSFYEIPDKKISAEQQVIDNEVAETLKKIIEKLPLEQRITVFMFYYEDMSVKEIALAYNVSENTVRSRLNYAKKFISSEVNKLEDKGIQLRSMAALPFLYFIFAKEEKAFAASLPESAIPSTSNVIAKVMKNSVANATTATKAGLSLGKIIAISVTAITVVTASVIGFATIGNKDETTSSKEDTNTSSTPNPTKNNEAIDENEVENETVEENLENWGIEDSIVAENSSGKASSVKIQLPAFTTIRQGPGRIAYQPDKSLVIMGGQRNFNEDKHKTDELFPYYFDNICRILETYRDWDYSNFSFSIDEKEIVEINGYEMCKYKGTHTYTYEEDNSDPEEISIQFVAYTTFVKETGAAAYWMVLDETEDQSLTEIIESHADNMAKTIREE